MQQPEEFHRFGSFFLDLSGEQHLNLLRPAHKRHSPWKDFEEMMNYSVAVLKTNDERRRVIAYLDHLLASDLSETQLSAIWQQTGARDALAPTALFFNMIREKIAEKLQEPKV